MQKIRKGDTVVITTGREKGKRGTVLRVLDAGKVLIEGVNRVKKHQRPNPVKGQTGGIVDKEMPLSLSNVMLVNPAKHPDVKKDLGQQFIVWLISPEGQNAIAGYKINGQQLFYSNANDPNA